jgi:hypothetical protein
MTEDIYSDGIAPSCRTNDGTSLQFTYPRSRIGCHRDFRLELMNEDRIFAIPITEMLEFSVALQLRFPDVSTRQIVRWPQKIDNTLKKLGLTYDAGFDYEPELMDIEKEDVTFFSEHGYPQIATFKGRPSFDAEYAFYQFEVEVFTPDALRSESRLAGTSLLPILPPWSK